MIARINELLQEGEALKAANAEELEALRIEYLSKKGAINELMADFRFSFHITFFSSCYWADNVRQRSALSGSAVC